MYKRYKESETIYRMDKIIKDRGDLKKPFIKTSTRDTLNKPDCGDSNCKSYRQKPDSKNGDYKLKNICKENGLIKKLENVKESSQVPYNNRTRIREKYTIRYMGNRNFINSTKRDKNEGADSAGEDLKHLKELNEEVKTISTLAQAPNRFVETENKSVQENAVRKPVIKTVIAKNNTSKMYKAVSFVNKKCVPKQLEIKMPTEHNNSNKVSRFTDINIKMTKVKSTVSRISVKGDPVIQRKSAGRRRERPKLVTSPEMSTVRNSPSPVTEVAKWVSTSITHDTKPYYEAWVDTTLAAVSNVRDNEAIYIEEKNKIKNFRSSIEKRDESPELFFKDFSDVKFTGKIKVRQRYVWMFLLFSRTNLYDRSGKKSFRILYV